MRRPWMVVVLIVGLLCQIAHAQAADVILNEYNAVSNLKLLKDGKSDVFWGRRLGNGQDWFELVVITDHLDMRGWQFEVVNNAGDPAEASWRMVLSTNDVWGDLRSGTIVTVSEQLGNNAGDYNPTIGQWWLNVKAAAETAGAYVDLTCINPSCDPAGANWSVTNDFSQVTIKDDLGTVIFGPAGEGVWPLSGVSSDEVFKLEENPSSLITPTSAYNDGTSSTFGQPNVYAAGMSTQDLSQLRSIVPFMQLESVRINEVYSHSDLPAVDWVELHNTTGVPVDVSGWFLSDSFGNLKEYEIPGGTTIPANGYLVIDETELGFAFSSACGDEVILSVADGGGALTGERDFAEFGAVETGVSFGRSPNASGPFFRMSAVTEGAANAAPLIGPVVINEIMYNPPDPGGGMTVDPEFVELHNVSGSPVDLFTDFGPEGTHPWRLTGGVGFGFSLTTTIPADGFLLVVNFDPDTEPTKLAEFRTVYGLDPSVAIVGPYSGGLNGFSDTVRLRKPDTPDPASPQCNGDPGPLVPQVTLEEVTYFDFGDWPVGADGTGASLQRIDEQAVAGEPSNWQGDALLDPTPGRPNCGNGVVNMGEDCDDGNQDDGDCCSSACLFDPQGAPCDDLSPCTTTDACDGTGACAGQPEPEVSCRGPVIGSLGLNDRTPDKRDKLTFKWVKGAATLADLGDPVAGNTVYELCAYDYVGGSPSIAMHAAIQPGGTCRGKPCWRAGSTMFRYSYGDGNADGITKVILKSSTQAKGKIILKGKGTNLPMPTLPLVQDPHVTVQLKNSEGVCWGAQLEAPARKNEGEKFKDKYRAP